MTPEQKQRIEQIEKRTASRYLGVSKAVVVADNDFLLSLVKSQEYQVNEVDAERLADYHKIGGMPAIIKSVDYGATSLAECVEMAVDRWYQRGRKDAATSVRSACVEKVKAMRDQWRTGGKWESEEYADAAEAIITALESVTIQEQK